MRTAGFLPSIVVAGMFCLGGHPHAQAKPAAVTPETLIALLPSISGWTKGKPGGQTLNMGMGMAVTTVAVSYEKDDSAIKLEITDTAGNQMLLGPFASAMKAGFSEKTSQGWRKAVTIAGFPGLESWDSDVKSANVIAIVNGRFAVKATATEVADTTMARKVVEAIDLKALAALK